MNLTFVLLVVLTIYKQYVSGDAEQDWIHPHSMDKDRRIRPGRANFVSSKDVQETISNEADLYFKRMIRLILNNAYLNHDHVMEAYAGHVNLKLSAMEYEELLDFSRSQEVKGTKNRLAEIHAIFEQAFQKTTFDRYKETVLSIQDELFYMIFNVTTGSMVAACIALFITYKLLQAQFTWKKIVQYFLFLIYIYDFIVCYLKIIQEEEIDQIVTMKTLGSTPPECDPNNMSWWNYFKTQFQSAFAENPCKQYYTVMNTNFLHMVQPLKILNKQFEQIIVQPINLLGEAFGKFGRSIFTSLPWGLNLILFPFVLVAGYGIIGMVLIFIRGEPFKLKLFHFIHFDWGGREVEANVPNKRRGRRGKIGAAHRQLIEDLRGNPGDDAEDDIVEPLTYQNQKQLPHCNCNEKCVPVSSERSPSHTTSSLRNTCEVSTNTTHQVLPSDIIHGANEESF